MEESLEKLPFKAGWWILISYQASVGIIKCWFGQEVTRNIIRVRYLQRLFTWINGYRSNLPVKYLLLGRSLTKNKLWQECDIIINFGNIPGSKVTFIT